MLGPQLLSSMPVSQGVKDEIKRRSHSKKIPVRKQSKKEILKTDEMPPPTELSAKPKKQSTLTIEERKLKFAR